MQTVAEYIAEKLYEAGVRDAFMITGGFSMPLTEALTRLGKIKYICMHHEQAATMAAEAYGRRTGRLGAAYITAGPGATNALTGVVGAWVDAGPSIVIAGQGKLAQARVTGVRQFPLQGFETLPIYKLVTKYAVMITDPGRVRYEIEKALFLATHGRAGPAWVEVPLDLQAARMDPAAQQGFDPASEGLGESVADEMMRAAVRRTAALLRDSRRPVVLAGAGVRDADAVGEFDNFIQTLNIPFVTSRLGMDLAGHDHPLFVGRPGTYGDRPANTAIQNSDVLLVFGCRLGVGLVGHDYDDFARYSRKIVVDIDPSELGKPSMDAMKVDERVCGDLRIFMRLLLDELGSWRFGGAKWIAKTQEWKHRYVVDDPSYAAEKEGVNSYHFTRVLSDRLGPDAVCVLDTGSCFHVWAQAFKVKKGQRHVITGGLSTMGYMPASIGVAAASPGRDVFCMTGDGSIQMNLQELQTIVHYKLPVKLLVLDNDGYLLIRWTQKNFFGQRRWGEGPETGVTVPEPGKLCGAYGLKFIRITSGADMERGIEEMLQHKGPVWLNVHTPRWQILQPRVASEKLADGTMRSKPYDDMFPFLPRDEYEANCVRNIS